MLVGSAVNCTTVGAAGGGGVVLVSAGGGGGGGGGATTFFLHPAANSVNDIAIKARETFRLLNMNNPLPQSPLFSPDRPVIISLRSQGHYLSPIRQHRINLRSLAELSPKCQMFAIRRPTGILVLPLAVGELYVLLRRQIHHKH